MNSAVFFSDHDHEPSLPALYHEHDHERLELIRSLFVVKAIWLR